MRRLAVLSMHTSPLAQPGVGDGGGMNVYVRELCTALARQGDHCDVFTRAEGPDWPAVVSVEPGLRVHHLPVGPARPVPKAELGPMVEEFSDAVAERLTASPWPHGDPGVDAIHAHYWLSGAAGHILKHRLDVPLVTTFHTLERVKSVSGASDGADHPERLEVEGQIIGCSDAVTASNPLEADHLMALYQAPPERVRLISPGVDHAFFGPGNRSQARRAVGLPAEGDMLLFLGRIQPLKGIDLAVGALAELLDFGRSAFLVVVGGPSGPSGESEMRRLSDMVSDLGLEGRVYFVPPRPHELISTYCRAADACVVPSRTESFGLVALEAAACGVPVVAAAVGGLRHLVVDGGTGVLVETRRPQAFAAALEQVLASPEQRSAMAAAAVARAAGFTWRKAAADLETLHSELSERRLVECV